MNDTAQKLMGTAVNKLFDAALSSKSGLVTTLILIVLGLVLGLVGAWLSWKLRRRAEAVHRQHVAETKLKVEKTLADNEKNQKEIDRLADEIKRRQETIGKLDQQIDELQRHLDANRPSWIN